MKLRIQNYDDDGWGVTLFAWPRKYDASQPKRWAHELTICFCKQSWGLGLDVFRDTNQRATGLVLGPFWIGVTSDL